MHFSIPDTQELNEGNGSTFIGYNIHINGVFHCTVRYKQLHNLNEQLKREFVNDSIPPFPPKKLLPLTDTQLEERRVLLEKYIQTSNTLGKLVKNNKGKTSKYEKSGVYKLNCGTCPKTFRNRIQELHMSYVNKKKSSTYSNHLFKENHVFNGDFEILHIENKGVKLNYLEILEIDKLKNANILLNDQLDLIGQDSKLVSSELIIGFLLSAQQETTCEKKQDINLDIYTMNNYQIPVWVSSFDRTEQVLAKAFKYIDLPLEYLRYFSLYLVKKDNSGEIIILRKLLDFESPYMSHKSLRDANKIVLRKSCWNISYDTELLKDPIALNLLYVQTVTEIEKGWIIASKEVISKLTSLQVSLAKREYIELAQKLKYYGFIQFMPCYCDYPKAQTKVLIAIGDQELSMRILGSGPLGKEGSFKVTRMRCWRITATHNKQETSAISRSSSSLELSFEYLMSKDKLQWITISSEQSILMSVCLQSLVDELIMKKNGLKRISPTCTRNSWSYMKRDGSSQLISFDNVDLGDKIDELPSSRYQESFSIKKLQEKFSSVSFKNGREFIENHAFECIGDDDL